MKVFKFGGASVKDAAAVRNVAEIIKSQADDDIAVVVSAMGKTTNALEKVLQAYSANESDKENKLKEVQVFHYDIMNDLFPFNEDDAWAEVGSVFKELEETLATIDPLRPERDYDKVVSLGEIISTYIVSSHLENVGIINTWLDAREVISTDCTYREAKVDMKETQRRLGRIWNEIVSETSIMSSDHRVMVTQGFIAGCEEGTTTLGREGSDYTGAILAWALDATELSIWKDVPGMLNADPKFYPEAKTLSSLSYKEALELSYYGASIIHPKTIKPLQNKNIALYVRSFMDPETEGSIIHSDDSADTHLPSYIFKQDQILMSIIPEDFSFIMEENISRIFALLAELGLKANLMQNSALSFSICLDDIPSKVDRFREELSKEFKVLYNQGLSLLTVRHYNEQTLSELLNGREILLEQKSRQTARFIIKGGFTETT